MCSLLVNLLLNFAKFILLVITGSLYASYSAIMIVFNIAISGVMVYVHFTKLIFYPFQFITTLFGINNQKFRDATINYVFTNIVSTLLSFFISAILYLIPLLVIAIPGEESEGEHKLTFKICMIIYICVVGLSAIAHLTEFLIISKQVPHHEKEKVIYTLPETPKIETQEKDKVISDK